MTMPDKVDGSDDGKRSARIRFILMILTVVSLVSAMVGGIFICRCNNENMPCREDRREAQP